MDVLTRFNNWRCWLFLPLAVYCHTGHQYRRHVVSPANDFAHLAPAKSPSASVVTSPESSAC